MVRTLFILAAILALFASVSFADTVLVSNTAECAKSNTSLVNYGSWDGSSTCTLTSDVPEGVVVATNNIVLDCDGHTITGTGPGIGVSLTNRRNVTVRNCIIRDFAGALTVARGISLSGSNNSLILNNTVYNDTLGIGLISSFRNNVTGNTAFNNTNDGILLVSGSSNNTLTGNHVSNGVNGIRLSGNPISNNDNVLTGNIANDNNFGFSILFSSRNTLIGNSAFNNTGDGIQLNNASNNTLSGNTASNNAGGIVVISGSSNNNLFGNNASNNRATGFIVRMTTFNNTLANNLASYNNVSGFLFSMLSALPPGNAWVNNIAQENGQRDFEINPQSDAACNITLENMTGSGGRPILFANSGVSWSDIEVSELILCNADGSTLENVTVRGSDVLQNNQLALLRTDDSVVTDSDSSNNREGIVLQISNRNNLTNNLANNNAQNGFAVVQSSNNSLLNNTANNHSIVGLNIGFGFGVPNGNFNKFINNTALNNVRGYTLAFSSIGNTAFGNVFCFSAESDINTTNTSNNTGDDNRCDTPFNWNDTGAIGCTFVCDADGDGVRGDLDNCEFVPNPGQEDFDNDGIGDACDDSDGDGFMDAVDKCRTTAGSIQGCPCGVAVEVVSNSKSLPKKGPLEGALVKVFDWTSPDSCAAQNRPKDAEFSCDAVNTCTTDPSGKCTMGLSCDLKYDVGVQEPPAQGRLVAWHSLGLVSLEDPQPMPVTISYRQANLEGGIDPLLLAFLITGVSALAAMLALRE